MCMGPVCGLMGDINIHCISQQMDGGISILDVSQRKTNIDYSNEKERRFRNSSHRLEQVVMRTYVVAWWLFCAATFLLGCMHLFLDWAIAVDG